MGSTGSRGPAYGSRRLLQTTSEVHAWGPSQEIAGTLCGKGIAQHLSRDACNASWISLNAEDVPQMFKDLVDAGRLPRSDVVDSRRTPKSHKKPFDHISYPNEIPCLFAVSVNNGRTS